MNQPVDLVVGGVDLVMEDGFISPVNAGDRLAARVGYGFWSVISIAGSLRIAAGPRCVPGRI